MRAARPAELRGNQMLAVEPGETVWLSASAGTGKTQVLTSRVLRLLLQPGVEPSQILCLTFTKAGATEMAARIKARLASWVRASDDVLAQELKAIGAEFGPRALDHARTLFAGVLDCPGGGLRIDTIHAFSQWLLGAFPHEANLVPGTRPMEDRERAVLARQVLADLLVEAAEELFGDPALLQAVEDLSLRMGPAEVEAYLLRCASAPEAWFGPGGWQEPMRPNILRLLGLPSDADESSLAALCGDDAFDVASLRRCLQTLGAWDSETGRKGAEAIEVWLAGDGKGRAEAIEALYAALFTKSSGAPRQLANILKRDPDYAQFIECVAVCVARVRETCALLSLADRLVPALRLGRAFALAWEEAKQREGLIDFDDQIRRAAALLGESTLADWIRYKLDRRFDHILVDEAQDTNAAQWKIIRALAEEFWSGLGQHGDLMRTLFVVGDYKQAIFRFQGTSPRHFEAARLYFEERMTRGAESARALRSNIRARELLGLGLGQSFRSAGSLLGFVDEAIRHIGHENFGLDKAPEAHAGLDCPGYVALWRPVGETGDGDAEDEPDDAPADWLSRPDRQMAENIARQIETWLDEDGPGFRLNKKPAGPRRAGPGDIMVLVRKRRELAGLIVARLHARGVPVAGVDRLRVGDPLAVRDLLAALRFAAQPLDDLSLACLLVSPLIGWSQDDLLRHGYREKDVPLWLHLRATSNPVLDRLDDLLRRTDFEPPQALLYWILSGPWQGRRRLVSRLGREANDPIDELLNAAHAFAGTATPSLAGFLNWFDAGEGELKREADNAAGLVRVMTVHGAKGLQAPIVILADATGDPDKNRSGGLELPDPAAPQDRSIPLPSLRKEEQVGRIAETIDAERHAEEEEHWRLLYVAMTRAEEALFIGGALGSREKEPAGRSWYAKLRELFGANDWVDDPVWSGRLEWGEPPEPAPISEVRRELPLPEPLPPWLSQPPAADPRPPRPLAPSSLGEEDAADPPYPPGSGKAAARRGTLIHRLLERLPELEAAEQAEAGARWLARNATDVAESEREAILRAALDVIADPQWAELFSPRSLAEVPIAASVGANVVAGTIDRLLIEPGRVRIVDFKTSRRPPPDIGDVPRAILRQMAAYALALERVYSGRGIEAALLYTAVPRLIVIPGDLLAIHKQDLMAAQ